MPDNPGEQTVRLATHAMGTRFELVLVGDDNSQLRSLGEWAVEEIEGAHSRLTRFQRGSEVSRVNRAAGGPPVLLGSELSALLSRCEAYATQSEQAFSIVREGETAVPVPGNLRLDPESGSAALPNPGTGLDLGGVAKGYALDLAADVLREGGVRSALLHGGTSTIVAIGAPPDAEAWTIALARPNDQADTPFALLRDRAISVSCQDGERPGHVVDPRTGEQAGVASWAACIGTSAEATDAWATALIVLGERPPTMPEFLTSVLRSGGGTTLASGPDAGCVTIRVGQRDGEG